MACMKPMTPVLFVGFGTGAWAETRAPASMHDPTIATTRITCLPVGLSARCPSRRVAGGHVSALDQPFAVHLDELIEAVPHRGHARLTATPGRAEHRHPVGGISRLFFAVYLVLFVGDDVIHRSGCFPGFLALGSAVSQVVDHFLERLSTL